MSDSIRTAQDHCPHCGHFVDAATPVEDGDIQAPNDFSICLYCSGMNVFDDDMKLRKATDSDLMQLTPEERAQAYRAQRMATTYRSFKQSLQK